MESPQFETERTRLVAIATRMLGSRQDADDVLQEAWLRLARTDGVDDLPAWLTTVVTRLCLDQLRRRRTRPPSDAGDGEVADPALADPEADALLAEQTGAAIEVVLEALVPAERVAFVLHDVFGYPFDQIAEAMGRSVTAVRQLASRARRKVRGTPETTASRAASAESRRVVDAFLDAARGGDLHGLLALLAPDVVMRADLAAQAMGTEPVYEGAAAVGARFNGARGAVPVTVDGELGAAWIHAGEVKTAFVFHVEHGVVHEIELIGDGEVLATMEIARVRGKGKGVDAPRPDPAVTGREEERSGRS